MSRYERMCGRRAAETPPHLCRERGCGKAERVGETLIETCDELADRTNAKLDRQISEVSDDANVNGLTPSDHEYCGVGSWEAWDPDEADQSSTSIPEMVMPSSISPCSEAAALARERDALRRALAAARARAAAAAAAHDARLAELHGVLAELLRRRAPHGGVIVEEDEEEAVGFEEVVGGEEDDCESETQPAEDAFQNGEDGPEDSDRTDMLTSTPATSPSALPAPARPTASSSGGCSSVEEDDSAERCGGPSPCLGLGFESSRWYVRTSSTARAQAQSKVASRVKLRRTYDAHHLTGKDLAEDGVCTSLLAEHLAREMRAHGELGEAMANATSEASAAALALAAARSEKLEADVRMLETALAEAKETAERLSLLCGTHESCCVALCEALRTSDRALETYDVLLALAETNNQADPEARAAAERVARALLARLEAEGAGPAPRAGAPLLSPGPWQDAHLLNGGCDSSPADTPSEGSAEGSNGGETLDARLRAHAARLKAATARARATAPPRLHSHHAAAPPCCDDLDCDGLCSLRQMKKISSAGRYHDMETAVLMQEVMSAREERSAALAALAAERAHYAALLASPDPRHLAAALKQTHVSAAGARRTRRRRHRNGRHNDESDL